MTIEGSLREMLEAAAEAGARKALEHCEHSPRRLVSIKSAPVGYRAILEAEKAGELRVYRRGRLAFVALDELEGWIMRAQPVPTAAAQEHDAQDDDVAELISISRGRR